MDDVVLETGNLGKRFGTQEAVSGLSLQVRRGEVLGLVGPDGAGKTTTLRLLAGVITPTTGWARVQGFDIASRPEGVRGQIGYMPQRFALYEDLTVQENLDFFADLYGVARADRRERQGQLLAASHMDAFGGRLAGHLSGGMKQKLALACTLVHRPRLLLLDEPTTGVDPISRREFWVLLHGFLVEGVTIVYSTPYMDEAERCSRVAFLSRGRLIACDSPRALKAGLGLTLMELEASPDRLARRVAAETPGVGQVQAFGERLHLAVAEPAVVESVLRARLEAAGVEVRRLAVVAPSLEDAFTRLQQGHLSGLPSGGANEPG